MTTADLIHEIDLQISRLSAARALLRNDPASASASILVSGGGTLTSHPVTFPMPQSGIYQRTREALAGVPPFTPLKPLDPLPLLAPAPEPLGKPDGRRKENHPRLSPRPRQISPAARERISQAQKKRWRAWKKLKKREEVA